MDVNYGGILWHLQGRTEEMLFVFALNAEKIMKGIYSGQENINQGRGVCLVIQNKLISLLNRVKVYRY